MYSMFITLFHSYFCVPAIAFNFTEKFITNHHPCPAIFMMIKVNESVIPEFLYPVGHVLRNDVVVDVDFKHTVCEYTITVSIRLLHHKRILHETVTKFARLCSRSRVATSRDGVTR